MPPLSFSRGAFFALSALFCQTWRQPCMALNGYYHGRACAQSTQALIIELKECRVSARNALLARSPDEVLPLLMPAVREDPAFTTSGQARFMAFEVLCSIGKHDAKLNTVIQNEEQIALLHDGLSDKGAGVRELCAKSMATVDPKFSERTVTWLRLLLADDDAKTVIAAATSLGALGSAAKPALQELLDIVRLNDDAPNARWKADRTTYPASSPDDIEVLVRQAAAFARTNVLGLSCDLAVYPSLDAHGRAAGTHALIGAFAKLMAQRPHETETISPIVQEEVIRLFVSYVAEPPSKLHTRRSDCLRMLALAAFSERISTERREIARAAIEARTSDSNPETRELASRLLADLGRKRH